MTFFLEKARTSSEAPLDGGGSTETHKSRSVQARHFREPPNKPTNTLAQENRPLLEKHCFKSSLPGAYSILSLHSLLLVLKPFIGHSFPICPMI